MDLSLNLLMVENRKVCQIKKWNNHNIGSLWMCLIEEVGELAASVRRHTRKYADRKKMSIENEIMDVLSYILQIADFYDIDLNKAWNKYINCNYPSMTHCVPL